MSLIDKLKLIVKPLRALIDRNSLRIDAVESDISSTSTTDKVVDMMIEMDALPVVADSDGAIFTDENGVIFLM